jgi:hypothetical protein
MPAVYELLSEAMRNRGGNGGSCSPLARPLAQALAPHIPATPHMRLLQVVVGWLGGLG